MVPPSIDLRCRASSDQAMSHEHRYLESVLQTSQSFLGEDKAASSKLIQECFIPLQCCQRPLHHTASCERATRTYSHESTSFVRHESSSPVTSRIVSRRARFHATFFASSVRIFNISSSAQKAHQTRACGDTGRRFKVQCTGVTLRLCGYTMISVVIRCTYDARSEFCCSLHPPKDAILYASDRDGELLRLVMQWVFGLGRKQARPSVGPTTDQQ